MIGLHGPIGAGKDTVFERMVSLARVREIPAVFERRAFGDKMKEAICALFDIERDELELLKRDESAFAEIRNITRLHANLGFRSFLQRFGTEMGRNTFGQDFWVEQAMRDFVTGTTYVFTDVRFANEAVAIRERNGLVIEVDGADYSEHASETRLPEELIDFSIENHYRNDKFVNLDEQIVDIVLPAIHQKMGW